MGGSTIRLPSRTEMLYNIKFSSESRNLYHALVLGGYDCSNGSHRLLMTFPSIYLVVCNVASSNSPFVRCKRESESERERERGVVTSAFRLTVS